jgi:hypothetical protein
MTFVRGWDDRDVYSKYHTEGKKLKKKYVEETTNLVKYGEAKITNDSPLDMDMKDKDTSVDIDDVKEINKELERMKASRKLTSFRTLGERNRAFFTHLIKYHVMKDKDYVIACSGEEGCQPAGSKVMMVDGTWKNIEDVKIGDIVLSPQKNKINLHATVLKIHRFNSEQIYKVINCFNEKILYECSEKHRIPIMDKGNIIDVPAEFIKNEISLIYAGTNLDGIELYKQIQIKLAKSIQSTVYGITIDSKSHWYITDNFMITRNCGKSAAVIHLGMEIMGCKSELSKRRFLTNNVVYDPTSNEMRTKIKMAKKGDVIIIDEAMKALYKRNYNTTTQKSLNVLFSTIRKKNLIIFMCIPNFFDLDKYFRTHRIKTWVYVPLRGRGIVFKRSNSPFADDPWEQRKNQQLLEEMDDSNYGKMADKIQIVKNLRKLKSYGIEFDFNDFEKEVKELYTKYKWWGGTEPNAEAEEYSDVSEKDLKMFKAETSIMDTVSNLKNLNYKTKEISKIMNMTPEKIKSILKKLKDNKLKEQIVNVKKIEEEFETNKLVDKIEKKIRREKELEASDESWKLTLE